MTVSANTAWKWRDRWPTRSSRGPKVVACWASLVTLSLCSSCRRRQLSATGRLPLGLLPTPHCSCVGQGCGRPAFQACDTRSVPSDGGASAISLARLLGRCFLTPPPPPPFLSTPLSPSARHQQQMVVSGPLPTPAASPRGQAHPVPWLLLLVRGVVRTAAGNQICRRMEQKHGRDRPASTSATPQIRPNTAKTDRCLYLSLESTQEAHKKHLIVVQGRSLRPYEWHRCFRPLQLESSRRRPLRRRLARLHSLLRVSTSPPPLSTQLHCVPSPPRQFH